MFATVKWCCWWVRYLKMGTPGITSAFPLMRTFNKILYIRPPAKTLFNEIVTLQERDRYNYWKNLCPRAATSEANSRLVSDYYSGYVLDLIVITYLFFSFQSRHNLWSCGSTTHGKGDHTMKLRFELFSMDFDTDTGHGNFYTANI